VEASQVGSIGEHYAICRPTLISIRSNTLSNRLVAALDCERPQPRNSAPANCSPKSARSSRSSRHSKQGGIGLCSVKQQSPRSNGLSFFARHVDSIDDCVRAPQSACNCCCQPSRLFHGGGMLSRASHDSRSALRSRWDHATAACVARCRSRLTPIQHRIKRCCPRCKAVDLGGAPHHHTDVQCLLMRHALTE
jgi:hypothetical protein